MVTDIDDSGETSGKKTEPAAVSGASSPNVEPRLQGDAEQPLDSRGLDDVLGQASVVQNDDGTLIAPDTMDSLIIKEGAETIEAPSAMVPEPLLDQAALEALLAARFDEPAEAPDGETSVLPSDDLVALDQSTIDTLLNITETTLGSTSSETAAPATSPKPVDIGALDQSSIDALLTGTPPTPVASETRDDSIDQSKIDALLNAPASEPTALSDDDTALAGQADIDALLAAAQSAAPQEAPASSAAPETETSEGFDQSDIDRLLASADVDTVLNNADMDAPVTESPAPVDDVGDIDQSYIDSLIANLGADGATPPIPPPAAVQVEEPQNIVSQDMIDSLISAAAIPETAPKAAPQKAQPAKPPVEGLLSQTDLDAVIAQARAKQKEKREAPRPTPAPQPVIEVVHTQTETAAEQAPPQKRREWKMPKLGVPAWIASIPAQFAFLRRLSGSFLQFAASFMAFLVASFFTFSFLYTHQERFPDKGVLARLPVSDLFTAMSDAQRQIDMGAYEKAIARLDQAIAMAEPGPERQDATLMRAEAAFKGLPEKPTKTQFNATLDAINACLAEVPSHPRAPEMLRWKAVLYQRQNNPIAAQDTYRDIIDTNPDIPDKDTLLIDAATLSLQVGRPQDAVLYLQRLIKEFPNSTRIGEARLLLGDAYADSGLPDKARELYEQLAGKTASSRLGHSAMLKLGELDIRQGKYNDAITRLEALLNTTAVIQGNADIQLSLARAYRAAGRKEDARRTLTDLIQFFPDSRNLPDAYIELTGLLEDLDQREEAIRIAQESAKRFPQNPSVLKTLGTLLAKTDDKRLAADTLMAAYAAGEKEPAVLLAAARLYRAAEGLPDAEMAYKEILTYFPRSNESLLANIEMAEVLCQRGLYRKGIQRLEDIRQITTEGPQQAPILIALARAYRDSGMTSKAAETFRAAAAATPEPAIQAEAAAALLDNNDNQDALDIINKLNMSAVNARTAHSLLSRAGAILLKTAPQQAVATLERVNNEFPSERTPEDEQRLLSAYLTTGNTDAARNLVDAIESEANDDSEQAPRLVKAAIALADNLYDAREYRSAAELYEKASRASSGATADALWAKYQRANALLQLKDLEASVVLFDEVADSNASFAQDATFKADYIRLEQRMRGVPVTPKATPATGAGTG